DRYGRRGQDGVGASRPRHRRRRPGERHLRLLGDLARRELPLADARDARSRRGGRRPPVERGGHPAGHGGANRRIARYARARRAKGDAQPELLPGRSAAARRPGRQGSAQERVVEACRGGRTQSARRRRATALAPPHHARHRRFGGGLADRRVVQAALDDRAIVPPDETARPAHRGQSAGQRRQAAEARSHRREGGGAAAEILQLVQARDGKSDEPASNAFSPSDIAVLESLNDKLQGRTALQKNPHPMHSMGWATWIIAKLGGWDGYPSSRPPGPITFRHGLQYFRAFTNGWMFRDVCMP